MAEPMLGTTTYRIGGYLVEATIDNYGERLTISPARSNPGQFGAKADADQAQAMLVTHHQVQITALIKQQEAMNTVLDGLTRTVMITKFALRDMNPDGGNTTIGGTAKLIGTRGSRLLGFLLNNHVLSTSTASGVFPLKPFKDRGYFVSFPELFGKQLNVLCPEVSITPAGRRWLHHNAALGWLDKILEKDVLATRFTPVTDLPLPLSTFDPMLP